jgi:demethylmenaquinone methyltransferase/2-methoxy-6-polyprenyl-1,4-benzoquinol methylase
MLILHSSLLGSKERQWDTEKKQVYVHNSILEAPEERTMKKGIKKIFSEVPQTYELVNHVLTFGLDVLWRRKAAKIATEGRGSRLLDICSGTGETAIYLLRSSGEGTAVVAADFSDPMIRKLEEKPEADRILLTLADASSLPFPDDTFDAITISFATRNISVTQDHLSKCFSEFHRVLRPGGVFVNMETSQPPSGFIRRLFHLYVRAFVRPMANSISGSKSSYAYLANSILNFCNAGELQDSIKQAGFPNVEFDLLLFGIVAVHKAIK